MGSRGAEEQGRTSLALLSSGGGWIAVSATQEKAYGL